MKQPWHVLAARCAAQNPSWPWEKVCAHVAKRRPRKVTPPARPTPQQYAAALEQLKLF
jgi:hypothetical protein